jgi:hypothetical protein
MGRILWLRALLSEALGEPRTNACLLARRALAATYDRGVKAEIERLVNRFCKDSEG